MQDLNLVDIWKVENPPKKDSACHSATPNTYSCIDYFIMSKSLAPNVSGCIYKSIIISDHALLLLNYSAKTTVTGKTLRCLKPQWFTKSQIP